MIDIEGLATTPDTLILTIGAQLFDPLRREDLVDAQSYYARVDFESQENRRIDDNTLEWWSTQHPDSKNEAFAEDGRIPLKQSLEELGKKIWHCKRVWMNGPTYDATILEHAYKSLNMALPWQYYQIRDCRTVYGLCPDLDKYPASHHAVEDCRRQIYLLWDTLEFLKVKNLV